MDTPFDDRPYPRPLTRFFNWKQFFASESDIIGGVLQLYSRTFSRILYFGALIYGVVFSEMQVVFCEQSQAILDSFIRPMCILPNYGTHELHGGPYRLPGSNEPVQFSYYIWVFALVLAQSFLVYIPLAFFQAKQKMLIKQLHDVNELISYDPAKEIAQLKAKKLKKIILEPNNNQLSNETKLEDSFRKALTLQVFLYDKTGARYITNLVAAHLLALVTIYLQVAVYVAIFGPQVLKTFFGYISFFFGFEEQFPENRVFPYFASCHFQNYGPSGSIVSVDSFCVMRMNLFHLYLINAILLVLLLFTIFFIVPITIKLLYIHTSSFHRKVVQWTSRIQPVFSLIVDRENINRLYSTDHLAEKIYFWSFAMLQFTDVETERLVQKVEDARVTLEMAAMEDLFKKLDRKAKNAYREKIM